MANNPDEMADMIDVLEDIKRWVKIIGIQEAKPTFSSSQSSREAELKRRSDCGRCLVE